MSYLSNLREIAVTSPSQITPTAVGERASARIGLQGRRVFATARLWRRALHPGLERFYWYLLKPLAATALILWYTPQYAGVVRRRCGVPILQQIAGQCRLGFGEWVNPRNYYFHEHFRRSGPVNCDGYVMRHEIKQGLMKAFHKMRPKPHGERFNLGHKLVFAEVCTRFGLPTPPVIAVARRGKIHFDKDVTLDRDLFVKLECGRGAIGAQGFLRVAPNQFRSGKRRMSMSLAQVLASVARRSRAKPQILQAMLRNHPAIAGLADQSLITIRVFTCLDAADRPVVTHAMLRTISKLEPDWPGSEEYAAAIDLASGRLGPMCGDSRIGPDAWYEFHPVTGHRVTGCLMPQWPAIRDLALAAHAVFLDRLLLGWDIALTPEGPTLLEANSYPDTEFLQRVHRQAIGDSPLGPLLLHHLEWLEKVRGGFDPKLVAELSADP